MSVLDRILDQKRIDVAKRRGLVPLNRLQREVAGPVRSLSAALSRPGLRFILEVKQRSPSAGLLRNGFDPVMIARSYQPVADAISVLTEPHFFHGSLEHLTAVRSQVSQPVLCKDFVVDPYQVFEARRAGADAILLMLSVLDDSAYRECRAAALGLQMEVLTEVHTERELERALLLGASMIGINNRDLTTLEVDLDTTLRLAPLVPGDRVVISESGIRSRADVDRLAGQARCFLVGSELMGAEHTGRAARRVIYGAVKICGLTREADAIAASQSGAVFGGVVLAPDSRRSVSEERARSIVAAAPLAWVGVFVNDRTGRIGDLARQLDLAAVQLHGDETADYSRDLRPLLPPYCEIWKAVPVRDRVPTAGDFGADRVLLDGHHPTLRGGSGRRFDWNLLQDVDDRSSIVLAGGLNPDNVRRAHQLHCGVLDVSSGVESAPGIKDHDRMQSFFAALRSV